MDYLDSSSAKMTISAAIRDRTDLMMNPRFRKRFVEGLDLAELTYHIAFQESDQISANPPEPSTVAKLPMPLLVQLDGLLTPESRKVLIDPIIKSRELQNDVSRTIITTRLIRLSEQGDYTELLKQIRNLPSLDTPIYDTEIQKIILNLSASGIDQIDAILEIERKMANIAGGSINVAKATFRTGHSEIGFRNWNLAYLRYISDPQFETRFPLDTMEIGRIDLIKKLYDRLFANNASLFLNMDDPCLRKFCSDSELLFASTQNFVDRPPFLFEMEGYLKSQFCLLYFQKMKTKQVMMLLKIRFFTYQIVSESEVPKDRSFSLQKLLLLNRNWLSTIYRATTKRTHS